MQGTLANVLAIILGAILGTLFGRQLPEKIKNTVMQGVGLVVLFIGLDMALETENLLIVLLSILGGAVIGELLSIQERLNKWGEKLKNRFDSTGGSLFTQGFVSSSLIYCVGALAVMGPLESGLTGEHSILYAKSILDGVTSIVLSATFGIGVAFSALAVLLYQGSITLMAGWVSTFLTEAVISEITATGGILIIGLGIIILDIKDIKVGNLLPALLFAFVLALFWN